MSKNRIIKTSFGEVMSHDMSTPFWQRINELAKETGFYEEIEDIMNKSRKFNKPYVDLTEEEKNS